MHCNLLLLLYNDYDNLKSPEDGYSEDEQVDVDVKSNLMTDSEVINPDTATMISLVAPYFQNW